MARYDKLVTRFPTGFTNIGPNKTLSQCPQPDPSKCHVFFNDFNSYVPGDWTVTETNAAATEALTPGNGGQLLITNTNVLHDLVAMSPAKKGVQLTANKRCWLECQFKLSDVVNGGIQVMFQENNTTYSVGSSLGFYTGYGVGYENRIILSTSKTGGQYNDPLTDSNGGNLFNDWATRILSLPTVVNNTFAKVSVYYDGIGSVYLWKDDVLMNTLSVPLISFPDDQLLYPTLVVYNQTAGANTGTIDYVFFAVER